MVKPAGTNGSCGGFCVLLMAVIVSLLISTCWYDVQHELQQLEMNSSGRMGDGSSASGGQVTYRIPSNGIVIFTNAANGASREAAVTLASTGGLRVLAGVKSKAELRSFAYEKHVGSEPQHHLEPFLLDIADQNTVLKLFYRVQELKTQYGKEIVGVVVDNVDESFDGSRKINWATEVDTVDTFIKTGFRSVAKFLQVKCTDVVVVLGRHITWI
jgi:hypothetical protein